MSKRKYYLTAPVYDAQSAPDIQSLYSAVLCDAIARHKRMCGRDVAYFSGTDAHGADLASSEERGGTERAAALQRNDKKHRELLQTVDVHPTHLQRSGSAEHVLAVQTLLRRILQRSQQAIYRHRYEGRYCPHDGIDVSDAAEPTDCAICGAAAVLISEERHFFRLSAYQRPLMAIYKYHPEFIQPQSRLEEIRSVVAAGLKDIPISRGRSEHGILWPDDPDSMVHERCVELAGYLSAIGFGEGGYGSDEFKQFWPANLHVVGRQALRSHAVEWPSILIAADLPVPKHIFAHGTVSFEGVGTDQALFPEPMMQALGSDAIRYYLLCEVGYGEDGRVDAEGLVRRCHEDLAEALAGLAGRVLTLVARHCGGKIPAQSLLAGMDRNVEIFSGHTQAAVRFLLDNFNFSEAIKKIRSLVAMTDKLLGDNARLELATDSSEKRRFSDVIHDACEELGWIALLLHPILPRATDAIWRSLGQRTQLEDQLVDETPWTCLRPGTTIGKLETLFPEVDNLQNLVSAKPEIRES